jgi:hypothetical protein
VAAEAAHQQEGRQPLLYLLSSRICVTSAPIGVDEMKNHYSVHGGVTLLVYHPQYPGIEWFRVIRGRAYTCQSRSRREFFAGNTIINQIERGVSMPAARALKCVPDIARTKKKDERTLGALFAPNKPRGSLVGLQTISEEHRFKGKDWEQARTRISGWDGERRSVGWMAKQLGVTPSALSKANKIYGLYKPRQSATGKKPKKAPVCTGFNDEIQGGSTNAHPAVESNVDGEVTNCDPDDSES